MSTYTFKDRDYPRVADCCGVTWNISRLVKKADGLYYCPDHKTFQPAIVLDRQNAAVRIPKVLPRKDAKIRDNVSIYQDREADLLKLIAEAAPYQYVDVTNGDGATIESLSVGRPILAAGEAVRALYDMVMEAKRPFVWMTQATAKISSLAGWLMMHQFGNALAAAEWSVAASAAQYGAFDTTGSSGTVYSEDVAAGLLALCYAYELTGTTAYLAAAQAAALCLRRMQCGDLKTVNFTATSNQGAGRLHLGMWTHSLTYDNCVVPAVTLETSTVDANSTDPIVITFDAPVIVSAFGVLSFEGIILGWVAVAGSVSPILGSSSAAWSFTPYAAWGTGEVDPTATVTADAALCSAQSPTWTFARTCTTPSVVSKTTTVVLGAKTPVVIIFSGAVVVSAFTMVDDSGAVAGAISPALDGSSATWTFTPTNNWGGDSIVTATVTADAALCSAQSPTWSVTT